MGVPACLIPLKLQKKMFTRAVIGMMKMSCIHTLVPMLPFLSRELSLKSIMKVLNIEIITFVYTCCKHLHEYNKGCNISFSV